MIDGEVACCFASSCKGYEHVEMGWFEHFSKRQVLLGRRRHAFFSV